MLKKTLSKSFLSSASRFFMVGALSSTLFAPMSFADNEPTFDPSTCSSLSALADHGLHIWPLRERAGWRAYGEERSGLMSNFGEFQSYGEGPYLHTGIDLRGTWGEDLRGRDLVRVVADGDVWAAPNFSGAGCTSFNNCRVYIVSRPERRYIYYYSHLNLLHDMDTMVRSQLEDASNRFYRDQTFPSHPVNAGDTLAGLGPFRDPDGGSPETRYSHLHFGIFDMCSNFAGIHPLKYLPAPRLPGWSPYRDESAPTIGPLTLVADGSTEEIATGGRCDGVWEPVDLILEAKDVFHDQTAAPYHFLGTDSVGVYEARYQIKHDDGVSIRNMGWYRFDEIPFFLPGEDRPLGPCVDDPTPRPLQTEDFICLTELNRLVRPTLGPEASIGGPKLGLGFADQLYSTEAPFASRSTFAGTERYFHRLTHSGGYHDRPGNWDPSAVDEHGGYIYEDGRYQISATVRDEAGNESAAHRWVIVDNIPDHLGLSPHTGDLVIRDHPADVGAIPSTLGDQPYWASPDIKVIESGTAPPSGPHDPIWDTTSVVDVRAGVSYEIYLRVENMGCDPLVGVDALIGGADANLIYPGWDHLGETSSSLTLYPGDAVVLDPVEWTPEYSGSYALLAITSTEEDEPSTTEIAGLPEMGWGPTVADDSNIAQLSVHVSGDGPIVFDHWPPFPPDVYWRFDCGDFPIYDPGASALLRLPARPEILQAWEGISRAELILEGEDLIIDMKGCKVDLPGFQLPNGTELPVSLSAELEDGPGGIYDLRLEQRSKDQLIGGTSFRFEHYGPQQ